MNTVFDPVKLVTFCKEYNWTLSSEKELCYFLIPNKKRGCPLGLWLAQQGLIPKESPEYFEEKCKKILKEYFTTEYIIGHVALSLDTPLDKAIDLFHEVFRPKGPSINREEAIQGYEDGKKFLELMTGTKLINV